MGRGMAVPLSWVSTWHTRTWDRVSSSAHPGRGHMVSGYIPLKSSLTPITAVHCVWILRASRYDASSLVKYLKQAQRPQYPLGPLNVIILRKG